MLFSVESVEYSRLRLPFRRANYLNSSTFASKENGLKGQKLIAQGNALGMEVAGEYAL